MYQLIMLPLILISLIKPITASKPSICVEKGVFADIRGPYEHLIFNESLNGDVYQYPRPQTTQYLYPVIVNNADYYYMISTKLYDSLIHSFCYIGNIAILGSNYLFDVKDCQYWAFYNGTKGAFQNAVDMMVSECQFNDICIEGCIYLPYLNTYYKYQYWNYTANGAVYYNNITNKYVYPYLQQINNKTYAKYIIDAVVGNAFANAYCMIGHGVPSYYIFDFKHCVTYRSYHQLQWSTDPNMTVGTNCTYTNSPTKMPTKEPTKNPAANPTNTPSSISPITSTNDHTQYPTIYQAVLPTNVSSSALTSSSKSNEYPVHNATTSTTQGMSSTIKSIAITYIAASQNAESNKFFRTDNNMLWYIVAAIIGFIALLIMICCLYVKVKKLVKKTSQATARQQRLESDISNIGSVMGSTPTEIRTFVPVQIPVVNNNNAHPLNNAINMPLPMELEEKKTETDETEMDDMFGGQQHEGERETLDTEYV